MSYLDWSHFRWSSFFWIFFSWTVRWVWRDQILCYRYFCQFGWVRGFWVVGGLDHAYGKVESLNCWFFCLWAYWINSWLLLNRHDTIKNIFGIYVKRNVYVDWLTPIVGFLEFVFPHPCPNEIILSDFINLFTNQFKSNLLFTKNYHSSNSHAHHNISPNPHCLSPHTKTSVRISKFEGNCLASHIQPPLSPLLYILQESIPISYTYSLL